MKVAIRNGILKTLMTNLLPQHLQSLLPSGYTVYERWISKKQTSITKIPESGINVLQDGLSKLFWVGDQDFSSNVVLFLHGEHIRARKPGRNQADKLQVVAMFCRSRKGTLNGRNIFAEREHKLSNRSV